MAKKIIPINAYADIKQYRDEGKSFTQDLLSEFAGAFWTARQEKEKHNIAGQTLMSGLIEESTSSSNMAEILEIYKTNFDPSFVSSNPKVNATSDVIDMRYEQKNKAISEFETSTQEFAKMLFSSKNIFKQNVANLDMEQVSVWLNTMSFDEKKGYMNEMRNMRDKVALFNNIKEEIFKGKSPDFKVELDGQMRSFREINQQLIRFDETMEAIVYKAFDDNIISIQEAQILDTISSDPNYDAKYVMELFDKKREYGAELITGGRELLNNDALKAAQKFLKDTDDIRNVNVHAEFIPLFQNEATSEVMRENIPLLDEVQYTDADGAIVTLPAITNTMTPQQKQDTFIKHLGANKINKGTLEFLIQNVFESGAQQNSAGFKMLRAFGGLDKFMGPQDPRFGQSSTYTDRDIVGGFEGPYAPSPTAMTIPKIDTKDIKKIPLTSANLDKYLRIKPKTPIATDEDFVLEEFEEIEPGTVEIPPTPTGIAKNLPEEFFTFIPFSENISDEMLTQTNNPYAITWGKKAEKYGGRKSERTFKGRDGKTYHYAEFDNYEHGMTAGKNIAADMWNEEDGNVEKFWTRYIGQTADSTEVKSRIRWTNDILKRYSPDYEEKVSPKYDFKFYDRIKKEDVSVTDKQEKDIQKTFTSFKNKNSKTAERLEKASYVGGPAKKVREASLKRARANLNLSIEEWWSSLSRMEKQKILKIKSAKDFELILETPGRGKIYKK